MDGSVMAWVLTLVGSPWTFVVIASVLAIGGVLTFLPSQALVVAVATLLAAGDTAAADIPILAVAACLGMLLGDLLVFGIAVWFGFGTQPWLNGERVETIRAGARHRLGTHPWLIMIIGRLLPMGRLVTDLAAADARLPLTRFVALAGVGDAVWSVYSVSIGAIAGVWAEEHPVAMVVVALAVSAALGFVFQRTQGWWLARRSTH